MEIGAVSDVELDMDNVEMQPEKEREGPDNFKKANRPVVLKFEDVVCKVRLTKAAVFCAKSAKTEEKEILKGITGNVLPGEMLAILGPSGSGKTTLLSALGSKLRGPLGGNITYNGKHFSNLIKRNMGFVAQDDVLYPHLTVTETLIFTAFLRLDNSLTKEEKITQAEAVITQLGLAKCKNCVIGGRLLRGVSAGERKRVAIGQEMLINPCLLFLDEPTSSLDSTTAQRIVSTLRDLAKGSRTIVMTIHEPSSKIFYLFQKVLLLADGYPLFFGEASQIMDYFSSIGHAPAFVMNPADFLLDLANGVSSNSDLSCDVLNQNLVSAYKRNVADRLKLEVQEIDDQLQDGLDDKVVSQWATTWWQQFSVLLRRGMKERNYETFSVSRIFQVLVIAFLSGFLWWQSDTSRIQDQMGLLFFCSGFWGILPLHKAIFTFPLERKMLEKEQSSGMYRLSSYFMSRIVSDLPMELVLPTIFVTITYWMAGLKPTPGNFLHTLLVIWYCVLVAGGLGLALGAAVLDQRWATILGSVIMQSFSLAGGYLVTHAPAFIIWVKYISTTHYTYKLLLGSQFKPKDTYPCGSPEGVCLIGDHPEIKEVGLGGQAMGALVLGIMFVGYRLIAYLALMRLGVTKKQLM